MGIAQVSLIQKSAKSFVLTPIGTNLKIFAKYFFQCVS